MWWPVPRFIVLYGGAVGADGRLNKDSAGRCNAALRIAANHPNEFVIFSVDGTIPRLRDATLEYLRDSGLQQHKIVAPSEAHNTWGETKAALKILLMHRANEVTVVSSWYHLPRIWITWRFSGFHGPVTLVGSSEAQNPGASIRWEIKGLIKLFWQRLSHKI